MGTGMDVEFRRTGARQYAVAVISPGRPVLEMNPAPGYDSLMPHDLIHFIVERELRIRHGIFGQLADGGTAGTFHPVADAPAPRRTAARRRRALARRGATLLQKGRADSAVSEQAADLCRRAWLARRAGTTFAMKEGMLYSARQVIRVCDVLDELSAAWVALSVGEALTLNWPAGDKERRIAAMRPNNSLDWSGTSGL
jgi:hypothetical protein